MSAHRNWFRDAVRNRSGVSAIEFALILPIMLTMYFGVVELGNATHHQPPHVNSGEHSCGSRGAGEDDLHCRTTGCF